MSPKSTQNIARLVDCARAAQAAPHGTKEAVYAAYCAELGMTRETLLKKLKNTGLAKTRKPRTDKGTVALPREEAALIVRWQRENARKMGGGRIKNMVSLQNAVDVLRSNGVIKAQALNTDTGEITALSLGSIRRAIEQYGLSSKVLDARAPSVEVAAAHPNAEWQVDASICTLYYLPKDGGLQEMKAVVFEKNKPANYAKVELDRVWRYVVVDKASHAIYVEYVFGGESGANLAQVLINAMQQREGEHLWGVPKMIYTDPGAAMTGGVMKQLCKRLGINLLWHMPGAAQATGSVEVSQNIVERSFESSLASRNIQNIDTLNALATQWRKRFNASAVHSRHGMTRYAAWCTITSDLLVKAPPVEVCMELATNVPKQCTVTQTLTVRFKGSEYQLNANVFEGVYVGQKVMVTRNAWNEDRVNVVDAADVDSDTVAPYIAVRVERNELGYRTDSINRGEGYRSHAHTAAQKQVAELEAAAKLDAANTPSAVNTRLKKPLPFGGKVDPFKPLQDAYIPTYLPRVAGEVQAVQGAPLPRTEQASLSITEACLFIKGAKQAAGQVYDPVTYTFLQARYPDGRVPQEAAEALAYNTPEAQATGTHDGAPVAMLRSVK